MHCYICCSGHGRVARCEVVVPFILDCWCAVSIDIFVRCRLGERNVVGRYAHDGTEFFMGFIYRNVPFSEIIVVHEP